MKPQPTCRLTSLFTSFLIFWNAYHWLYPVRSQSKKETVSTVHWGPLSKAHRRWRLEDGGSAGEIWSISRIATQDYAISIQDNFYLSILYSGKIVNDFKPSRAALFLSLLDIILMIQMPLLSNSKFKISFCVNINI